MNHQPSSIDAHGKHRILAELKRLEQETRYLEFPPRIDLLHQIHPDRIALNELDDLEKLERAPSVCKEFLSHVQTRPDPLLPETNGPLHPSWDRWFEGPQDSKSCRCCIL